MLLEVIMPTYNGVKYLSRQIETIYHQTLKPDRLLIRDDGSTDGTLELIDCLQQLYGNWITRLVTVEHLGCCACVNILLSATQARYVALADQDDLWHPKKLEKSMELMREMEKVYGENMPLLVHGDLRLVNADGEPMGHTYFAYQRLDPRRIRPVDLAFTNVVTGCTCLFNKNLLAKALPIPAEAAMHDWWIALVASVYGRIGLLMRPYIDYRQHESNLLGAKGMSYSILARKLFTLLVAKDINPRTRYTFKQIDAFSRRYNYEISRVPSLLRLSLPARWLALLLLPSRCRPSRHGVVRSLLFYCLVMFSPSNILDSGN